MKGLRSILILSILLTAALLTLPVFAQDQNAAAGTQAQVQEKADDKGSAGSTVMPSAAATSAVMEEAPGAKEISIYGEVQSVNAAASSMTVQYYDYDSDEEKTIEIVADKDTKLENAAAISNIIKGDWVDTTYAIVDAKNVAKSIIVEKEEKEEDAPADAAQGVPAQPVETPAE